MSSPIAPTKILVIRFSSIGDIVLTTPVLRLLKSQLEGDVEIHFLTKRSFGFLLANNPYVSEVHTIEKSVQEVIPQLKALNFDYIIDLHNNIRSRVVKRSLGSLSFTFDKLNVKKWLWVNFGINLMPNIHIVDRYLDTIKAFGIKPDDKGLDYFASSEAKQNAEALLNPIGSSYIAIAVGGAHIGKRMSQEKWADLCKTLKHPIVILGGREDSEAAAYIMKQCGGTVHNLVGKCSVDESAWILKNAAVVVSGDTGMMHIASAFGKKIVSLWGCTTPGLGMSPYKAHPSSMMLEPEGRKRRPCSKLGNRCKYGSGSKRCIEQLDISTIATAIEKLWALQTMP